jgi:hypothetical protein
VLNRSDTSKWTAFSAALMVVFLLVQIRAMAAEQAVANDHPDLATIIRRMSEAQSENHARIKAYSVTREYRIFGADAERPRTQVVAKVNFLPPNQKSYDLDQSTGGMGEKIVRRILDHEVDATRDPKDLMVDAQNYDFAYMGNENVAGMPCYKLKIDPKHDRKDLLKAVIWVDKDTYRLVKMDGEPAKSPSFWVKDVHLVLYFNEVAGMWLQTGTRALAKTRFGGQYNVVSNDLSYDVERAVAVNVRPNSPHRHRSATLAASALR